jgi:hypothetical protein
MSANVRVEVRPRLRTFTLGDKTYAQWIPHELLEFVLEEVPPGLRVPAYASQITVAVDARKPLTPAQSLELTREPSEKDIAERTDYIIPDVDLARFHSRSNRSPTQEERGRIQRVGAIGEWLDTHPLMGIDDMSREAIRAGTLPVYRIDPENSIGIKKDRRIKASFPLLETGIAWRDCRKSPKPSEGIRLGRTRQPAELPLTVHGSLHVWCTVKTPILILIPGLLLRRALYAIVRASWDIFVANNRKLPEGVSFYDKT